MNERSIWSRPANATVRVLRDRRVVVTYPEALDKAERESLQQDVAAWARGESPVLVLSGLDSVTVIEPDWYDLPDEKSDVRRLIEPLSDAELRVKADSVMGALVEREAESNDG